jgi:hypothetical protein
MNFAAGWTACGMVTQSKLCLMFDRESEVLFDGADAECFSDRPARLAAGGLAFCILSTNELLLQVV